MIHPTHKIYEGSCDFPMCTVCNLGGMQLELANPCLGAKNYIYDDGNIVSCGGAVVKTVQQAVDIAGKLKPTDTSRGVYFMSKPEINIKKPEPIISRNDMGPVVKAVLIIGISAIILSTVISFLG